MKERIIKVLQVTRKFGFIMAAVMVFPYVSSFPAVMASDGESTTEVHEVSIEELEQEYFEQAQAVLQEEAELQEFYSRISDELGQYIVETDGNIYELIIPVGVEVDFTEEELENFKRNLQITNDLMSSSEIYIDENGDYYTLGEDDVFVSQSLQLSRYSLNKYHYVKIPFKTIRVWYGIDLGLTREGSFIIGAVMFGGGFAVNWMSTSIVRTKVNQHIGPGFDKNDVPIDWFKNSIMPKLFNWLTGIGISSGILSNINNIFNSVNVEFVSLMVNLLSTFATVFLIMKTVLTAAGGPVALLFSCIFGIAGGQLISAGITSVIGAFVSDRNVVKYRVPLTISSSY